MRFQLTDTYYPDNQGSDLKTDKRNRLRTPENVQEVVSSVIGRSEPYVPKKRQER